MWRVYDCITEQHDIRLVLLAGVICLLACYTAFSLLGRAALVGQRSRFGWLGAAAVVTGSGVWSTHFVAMLAFQPGFPIGYDVTLTALSVVIAVVVSGMGLLLALQGISAAFGGAVVGAAVGSMHFTGMKALHIPAVKHWDPTYVHTSLIIGVAMGALALWLFQRRNDFQGRMTAAGVLALGICGLHFTAMAAFSANPDPRIVVSDQVIAPEWLAVAIAAVTLLIVALGLAGSVVDEHLAGREAREAKRLREHVVLLEATQRELQEKTDRLTVALQAAAAGSQAKSQFLAILSHELRTPLNAIIGFSDVLTTEIFGALSAQYREYSRSIADSGRHLLGLINDILDFSEAEAGRFQLREEIFNLGAVIDESIQMISRQAEKGGIRVHADVPVLPDIRADPQRVRQVLLNVLSNAIKFSAKGGSVRITADVGHAGLCVVVADTGIGMADKDLPNALQQFVQIDGDLNRKYGGTGLGLPLSKRLMELHGGTLAIQSTIGIGTTVSVTFPVHRLQPDAVAAAGASR